MAKLPFLVVFTEETRIALSLGVLMVAKTVIPFQIDGSVTASALPRVIVRVLFEFERVNFVVGVFFDTIARKVLLLNGVGRHLESVLGMVWEMLSRSVKALV
jgi:hypothetical protein